MSDIFNKAVEIHGFIVVIPISKYGCFVVVKHLVTSHAGTFYVFVINKQLLAKLTCN